MILKGESGSDGDGVWVTSLAWPSTVPVLTDGWLTMRGWTARDADAVLAACQDASLPGRPTTRKSPTGATAPGSGDLFLMSVVGSGQHRIRDGTGVGSAELPTWSLDGEEIAYICGCGEFRAIKPDGTGDRLIWDPDPGATGGPDRIGSVEGARISFSPDGSRLAVAISPSGTGPPVEIWTVGRDGGNPTRLTTGAIDQNVDFSPDGKKIVLNRTAGVTTQIWVMNADGSGQTPIKSGPSDVTPDFSPDGRKIVFARITGNESQLFTMNADGTGQTPLGTTGSQPAWGP